MRIFTLSQLAREAHVSKAKVRAWITQGLIALQVNSPGRRPSWRISAKHFADFIDRQQQQQQAPSTRPAVRRAYPE